MTIKFNGKIFYTLNEFCHIFDYKPSAVYRNTHKNRAMPNFYKLGKRIYFEQKDINEWIKTGYKKRKPLKEGGQNGE